jgi:integrase
MVRHRAMPAASDDGQGDGSAGTAPFSPVARGPVLPPMHPDIDPQRYAGLANLTLRNVDKRYEAAALETARRLCCLDEPVTHTTDRTKAGNLARYLVSEAVRVGGFNYKSALRRANVDRALDVMALRLGAKSIKLLRSEFYAVGRRVHPREYPPPRSLVSSVDRSTATSPEQIRRLYTLAPSLPTLHSQRLLMVLDLCHEAGARPSDLKTLRGVDIHETTWDAQRVALVRLANRGGGTRVVPVADPAASARLLAAAADRGAGYLMTFGGDKIGRNTANKVSEYLIRRGHEGVNAAAVRHRWMLNLAQRVPAALLMQLADAKELRVLAEQQHLLSSFGIQHAISWVKGHNDDI